MTEPDPDRMVQLLAPRLDIPHAVADPTGPAADDLLARLLSAPPTPRRRWGLRLAIGAPLVAGLAAAVVAASVWLPESTPGGPAPAAAALQITTVDQYLEIRILDPAADPSRYRRELAARGLDIELSLAAAEPDEVGRVVFQEDSKPGIEPVESPGDCTANGNCGVGVKVPLSYDGHATIVFGRTPLPGESVEGDAPVLTPAQKGQIKSLLGRNVSEVRRMLAENGWTASYRISKPTGPRKGTVTEVPAAEVPDSWIAYDVAPLPGDVVAIWVSKDGKAPVYDDDVPQLLEGTKKR